jgi:uncharacterized protein YjbI with pentapeptide repeats
MTAEELLSRYAAGERNFSGVDLRNIDPSGSCLININSSEADLSGTNLN